MYAEASWCLHRGRVLSPGIASVVLHGDGLLVPRSSACDWVPSVGGRIKGCPVGTHRAIGMGKPGKGPITVPM